MSEEQGYYSLIQYSEFPERIEFVNIGVILFAKRSPRVFVRFSESARRVERVFGVGLGVHFGNIKTSLESRVQNQFGQGWDLESIEKFVSLRSGKLRLSPPRSILVREDPRSTVGDLFEKLVVEIKSQKREPRVTSKLRHQFELKGVEKLLEKPQPHDAAGDS